jgi:hypothetical protein
LSPGIVDNFSDGRKYAFLHYIVPIEHQAYMTKKFLSDFIAAAEPLQKTVTMPLSAFNLISFSI